MVAVKKILLTIRGTEQKHKKKDEQGVATRPTKRDEMLDLTKCQHPAGNYSYFLF